MGIILAGHQCSGTAHLRRVLETHPDIALSGALGCYNYLGMSATEHSRCILRSFSARRNNPFALHNLPERKSKRTVFVGKNLLFVFRYLKSLSNQKVGMVTAPVVEMALKSALHAPKHAGDKNHDYWYETDRLAPDPHIDFVIIVRDARDVVSATVSKARGVFRNYWPAELRDAGNVAGRWVKMVETAERNRGQVHVVYYEQLARHPQIVLNQLAAFLDVDEAKFDSAVMPQKSIGEYQQGLSAAEQDDVLAIAGDSMKANGYDLDEPGLKSTT